MSPRTGRPKAENPKNIQVKFLADRRTVEDLDFCCVELSKTQSDITPMGIQKVKAEAEK